MLGKPNARRYAESRRQTGFFAPSEHSPFRTPYLFNSTQCWLGEESVPESLSHPVSRCQQEQHGKNSLFFFYASSSEERESRIQLAIACVLLMKTVGLRGGYASSSLRKSSSVCDTPRPLKDGKVTFQDGMGLEILAASCKDRRGKCLCLLDGTTVCKITTKIQLGNSYRSPKYWAEYSVC